MMKFGRRVGRGWIGEGRWRDEVIATVTFIGGLQRVQVHMVVLSTHDGTELVLCRANFNVIGSSTRSPIKAVIEVVLPLCVRIPFILVWAGVKK